MKKQLSIWQAACIITGYGLGAGVLSMPYLVKQSGVPAALFILTISLLISYLLHLMIAQLALAAGGNQVIACLSRFLFRGKWEKILTVSFFVMIAGVLVTNLAAYIIGAAEVIDGLLALPEGVARILFYGIAAAVVLFGLKAVGISETIAVTIVFLLIGVLGIASLLNIHNQLPVKSGSFPHALSLYGMAMFAMTAFFAVPQAVEGLDGDRKKIKKAIFLGIFNNYILILVIMLCSLLASTEVTEVVMVGWSQGIGFWAQIIGSVFTILAMLTTYWSLSLALSGIVEDMLKLNRKLCWLLATLPSLIVTMLNLSGFMGLMRIAGGLIALAVAVMVVPAYRNACRETSVEHLLRYDGFGLQILIVAAYILMAIGSVVPV